MTEALATILLVAAAASAVVASSPLLRLDVSDDGGKYAVSVNGEPWLLSAASGAVAFRVNGTELSLDNGTLSLTSSGSVNGTDQLGAFEERFFVYSGAFRTSFRTYPLLGAALFEQRYLAQANGTAAPGGAERGVASSFPAFGVGAQAAELGYYAWGGAHLWTNNSAGVFGSAPGTFAVAPPLEAGPLALFSRQTGAAAVLSPASSFMSGAMLHDGQALRSGLLGSVTSVPAGHSYRTLVAASPGGVTAAAEAWGALLQRAHNTVRFGGDISLSHLSFATDNGAETYYNPLPNKTFEDTVLALRASADRDGIPARSLQLDSWFYAKGLKNGVTVWRPTAEVYPDGGVHVFNATGWPLMAHNRFWASDTPYARDWPFISHGPTALPVSRAFWDWLFRTSVGWGVATYEQDWLYDVLQRIPQVVQSATLGRDWLTQMGGAAADHRLAIQYCMAWPRHALASLEIGAVTQVRASDDYHPGNEQWRVGRTSLLAHALGLAPSKDNFWTSTSEPLNPYNLTEPYPGLEAAVAVLSTGPVQLGDGPGMADPAVAARLCAADGRLLGPSRPATAVDSTYAALAFGGGLDAEAEVWRTRSDLGAGAVYGHVFAANLSEAYEVTAEDAGMDPAGEYVLYAADGRVLDGSFPLTVGPAGRADFELWHAAPQRGGKAWVMLGELDKVVPVSPARFRSLQFAGDAVEAGLVGAAGEAVTVSFYQRASGRSEKVTVALDDAGTGRVVFPGA